MAQTNKENQRTDVKSSKASESLDETMALAEKALEETGDIEAAYEKLTASTDELVAKPAATTEPAAEPELAAEPTQQAEAPIEDDDDEYNLPSSYRKETRELFAKLPKNYEPLKREFAKRANMVERDRQKFYSEYQSKTAFAQKLAQAINPYLETFTARGITPEVAVARAAKLDALIQQDPVAAAKFAMQIANIRELKLDEDEAISPQQASSNLTANKAMSQDDIKRIIREEVSGITQVSQAYQSNLEVVKGLADKKTQSGLNLYPDLQNAEFCKNLEADVAALVNQGKPFDKAVLAAYYANGGRVEQDTGARQQPSQAQQRDSERAKRLQVASNIRPASSSTNSIRLDDISIPDSIEDTFALAEKLLGG